ncbi:MAG: tetrathionate reductase family octaheme c-type cytochrome [Thermodesulfobacteriota bacterium]
MGIESNWCSCTKCHPGYGWKDDAFTAGGQKDGFDFNTAAYADCLVCHDTTGTYGKKKNTCGYPNPKVDLGNVARNVGMPDRSNCGACHWYGGGGNNVKHGDMGKALADPDRSHDVHMGGLDFTCQKCHTTENHKIAGRSTTSSVSEGKVACTDCHDSKPHNPDSGLAEQLNDHGEAIACQTCHIPEYAKANKTTTRWDWSKSGKSDKVLEKTDRMLKMRSRKKGLLVKQKQLTPSYEWYNGKHRRYLKGDAADMDGITEINPPVGGIDDPSAKIWPYKLMEGVVPADAEYGYLIVPQLFGDDGYFQHFDWQKAAEKGMAAADLEFSGEVTFVETVMHWRLNHEVAPAQDALSCLDCHGTDGVMDFKALGYEGDPAVTGGRKAAGQ